MTLSIIPVTSDPNQTFECTLPIDGNNRRFKFFFEWNPIGSYWQFDLYDIADNNKQLLNKQPIYIINYPSNNIISNFIYKGIGSLYVVNLTGKSELRPTLENLSSDYALIWGDTPDAETVS